MNEERKGFSRFEITVLLGALAWLLINLVGDFQAQNRAQWQQSAKIESRMSYLEGYHAAERCIKSEPPKDNKGDQK